MNRDTSQARQEEEEEEEDELEGQNRETYNNQINISFGGRDAWLDFAGKVHVAPAMENLLAHARTRSA